METNSGGNDSTHTKNSLLLQYNSINIFFGYTLVSIRVLTLCKDLDVQTVSKEVHIFNFCTNIVLQ